MSEKLANFPESALMFPKRLRQRPQHQRASEWYVYIQVFFLPNFIIITKPLQSLLLHLTYLNHSDLQAGHVGDWPEATRAKRYGQLDTLITHTMRKPLTKQRQHAYTHTS